ncbi:hypothetical protein PoMZ_05894 [Pyricularia oryzae]|uniref:Uncharacterized protein n=1 Tax=Pyricularia oryzae TaxID=318829 RepID=A0A4P7NPP9_PYROR|nr:hypothetical protein PoMZ_05894 [Pyricularia oryzae]
MVSFTQVYTFGLLFTIATIVSGNPEKFMVSFGNFKDLKPETIAVAKRWENAFNEERASVPWKATGYTIWNKEEEGKWWGWISSIPNHKHNYSAAAARLNLLGFEESTTYWGAKRWVPKEDVSPPV